MTPVITYDDLHNKYAANCRLRDGWHTQLMWEHCHECDVITHIESRLGAS